MFNITTVVWRTFTPSNCDKTAYKNDQKRLSGIDRTLRCRVNTSAEFSYRLLVAISVTWVTFADCAKSALVKGHLSRDVPSIHSGQMFYQVRQAWKHVSACLTGNAVVLITHAPVTTAFLYNAVLHNEEGQCQGNMWCQVVRVLPVTWLSTPLYSRVQLTGTLLSICRIR